jgi:hypothetical protein
MKLLDKLKQLPKTRQGMAQLLGRRISHGEWERRTTVYNTWQMGKETLNKRRMLGDEPFTVVLKPSCAKSKRKNGTVWLLPGMLTGRERFRPKQ